MSTPFKGGRHIVLLRLASALWSGLTLRHPLLDFLAHLWGAYAIPLASSVVRRESSVVRRVSSVSTITTRNN